MPNRSFHDYTAPTGELIKRMVINGETSATTKRREQLSENCTLNRPKTDHGDYAMMPNGKRRFIYRSDPEWGKFFEGDGDA